MLKESSRISEFKTVKLGKTIEFRYIPFSELAIPWNVCFDAATSKKESSCADNSRLSTFRQTNLRNGKATKTLKDGNLEALKRSIAQYGLLKPFEVAEIQGRLDFFYGDGKYMVIDGQRRYFAVRELLKLPTEDEERNRRDGLRTDSVCDSVAIAEMQAQKQFDKLSIRDYVLIPCLVYPYTTLLQMIRHSIEDKRFSEQPSKQDFELVDKMGAEGISDLNSDDLTELWNTRPRIEEEKLSIENTLEEIRNKSKKQDQNENKNLKRTTETSA